MTEITAAQAQTLIDLQVEVGESHFPYGLDAVLVFSPRFRPDGRDTSPFEVRPSGEIQSVGAGYGWSGTQYPQGEANIHAEIDAVNRAACRIAPRFAEQTLDTGCTNWTELVQAGPLQRKAFDMVAYAHVLNAIADIPVAVRAWGFEA